MTRRVKLLFFPLVASTGFLQGCDDAVSPPPEAAVSIALHTDDRDPEGRTCPAIGTDSLPSDDLVRRLNANTRQEDLKTMPRLTSGKDDAVVSCKVVENAESTYTISASLRSNTEKKTFALAETVVAAGAGQGARISWISPSVPSTMSSSLCTLVVDEQIMGGGAIQVTYDCPQFLIPSQPSIGCRATGTLIIERCDK